MAKAGGGGVSPNKGLANMEELDAVGFSKGVCARLLPTWRAAGKLRHWGSHPPVDNLTPGGLARGGQVSSSFEAPYMVTHAHILNGNWPGLPLHHNLGASSKACQDTLIGCKTCKHHQSSEQCICQSTCASTYCSSCTFDDTP